MISVRISVRSCAAALLIILAWPSFAVECTQWLADDSNSAYAYQPRDKSPRCEGLVMRPSSATVADPEFSLVSATVGEIKFDTSEANELLRISVPSLTDVDVVNVVGQSIGTVRSDLSAYRLDIASIPEEKLSIPIEAVIRNVGLTSNDIGLVGRVNSDGRRRYVPLTIEGEDTANTIHIRLQAESLRYKIKVYDRCRVSKQAIVSIDARYPREVIHLQLERGNCDVGSLEVDSANGPKGALRTDSFMIYR